MCVEPTPPNFNAAADVDAAAAGPSFLGQIKRRRRLKELFSTSLRSPPAVRTRSQSVTVSPVPAGASDDEEEEDGGRRRRRQCSSGALLAQVLNDRPLRSYRRRRARPKSPAPKGA